MFPLRRAPRSRRPPTSQMRPDWNPNQSDSRRGIYTLEQIAEARRRVLDHLQRQVKDLTDWQFKEQCDIAGLDQFGDPNQLTDEQISSAQRAMDHENVLTRTRAMGALRRAEAMSDSPISPRALSS